MILSEPSSKSSRGPNKVEYTKLPLLLQSEVIHTAMCDKRTPTLSFVDRGFNTQSCLCPTAFSIRFYFHQTMELFIALFKLGLMSARLSHYAHSAHKKCLRMVSTSNGCPCRALWWGMCKGQRCLMPTVITEMDETKDTRPSFILVAIPTLSTIIVGNWRLCFSLSPRSTNSNGWFVE